MDPHGATSNPSELGAHAPWIRTLALRLVRDEARADDLVQETLLAALEQRPETGRPLRPWMRRVLANRHALGLRGEARRGERERASARHEALPSTDELAQEAEVHARLVRALTRLREPYRTALLLRYYEGLAPKDIATRLALSRATVRSHLRRGLAHLRVQLDGEHDGERRAWCLALVPIAARAPGARAFTHPLSEGLRSRRAMHPIVHLVAATGALLLTAPFLAEPLGLRSVTTISPESPGASVVDASPAERPARAAGIREPGTLPVVADEPVVGYVYDRETGAPLHDYAVRLNLATDDTEGEGELLWTDAAGRFESAATYPVGAKLHVGLRDHPGLRRVSRTPRQVAMWSGGSSASATWDPAQGPLGFHRPVGPTYQLSIDAPFEVDPEQLVATLEATERAPYGPLEVSHQMRAPLRVGEQPWARFGALLSFLPADRPWSLGVESNDGFWAGAVEVDPTDGVHDGTVEIALTPAARLEVEVVAPTEFQDMTVFAERLEDGTRRLLWTTGRESQAGGGVVHRFHLQALSAGDYRVSASADGTEQVATETPLVAGQVNGVQLALAPGSATSHVHGELNSLSGQYREPITLYLSGLRTGTETMHMPKWEEQGSVWVAPFVFDNLPADTYALSLYSFSDFLRWDTLPVEVVPPADELLLTCRDTDPTRRVEIHTRDAPTGETLQTATAWLTAPGCATPQMMTGAAGRNLFQQVPLDAEFTWWSMAPGYVPRFGDEHALVVDGDVGRIDVELHPGWGARIQAVDEESRAPVAGVAVLLDAAAAGTTDHEGLLDLAAEGEPTHVDLELVGWEPAGGQYDPEARALTGSGPVYRIAFRELE